MVRNEHQKNGNLNLVSINSEFVVVHNDWKMFLTKDVNFNTINKLYKRIA